METVISVALIITPDAASEGVITIQRIFDAVPLLDMVCSVVFIYSLLLGTKDLCKFRLTEKNLETTSCDRAQPRASSVRSLLCLFRGMGLIAIITAKKRHQIWEDLIR